MADLEQTKQVFLAYDVDGDGTIERREMMQLLVDLDGDTWTLGRAGLLTSCIDQNSDGKIDMSEFLDWIFMDPTDAEQRALERLLRKDLRSLVAGSHAQMSAGTFSLNQTSVEFMAGETINFDLPAGATVKELLEALQIERPLPPARSYDLVAGSTKPPLDELVAAKAFSVVIRASTSAKLSRAVDLAMYIDKKYIQEIKSLPEALAGGMSDIFTSIVLLIKSALPGKVPDSFPWTSPWQVCKGAMSPPEVFLQSLRDFDPHTVEQSTYENVFTIIDGFEGIGLEEFLPTYVSHTIADDSCFIALCEWIITVKEILEDGGFVNCAQTLAANKDPWRQKRDPDGTFEDAQLFIRKLNKHNTDLKEFRSFGKPPPAALLPMRACAALLGDEVRAGYDGWKDCRTMLEKGEEFRDKLLGLDPGAVSGDQWTAVKTIAADPEFTFQRQSKCSRFGSILTAWVLALVSLAPA